MIFKVFCVYDDKAKAYLPPFFLPEVSQAIRAFGDAAQDSTHDFCKHPEDYTLFQLGTFNSSSGVLTADGPLSFVINGLEVRAQARRVAEDLAFRMAQLAKEKQP